MQQGVDGTNAADDAKQLAKTLGLPSGAGDPEKMQALAALVEKAEAWRDDWVGAINDPPGGGPDLALYRAIDHYREVTR